MRDIPGSTVNADDRPLILVDFTALSDGKLHNKFDKASCNDADLKRCVLGAKKNDFSCNGFGFMTSCSTSFIVLRLEIYQTFCPGRSSGRTIIIFLIPNVNF